MCGSPALAGQAIIPLKSKLYYDEIVQNKQPANNFSCYNKFNDPAIMPEKSY